jgi:acetyl esterase/lipase
MADLRRPRRAELFAEHDTPYRLSPDGEAILHVRRGRRRDVLTLISAESLAESAVVRLPGEILDCAWFAGGRQVGIVASRGGRTDLWCHDLGDGRTWRASTGEPTELTIVDSDQARIGSLFLESRLGPTASLHRLDAGGTQPRRIATSENVVRWLLGVGDGLWGFTRAADDGRLEVVRLDGSASGHVVHTVDPPASLLTAVEVGEDDEHLFVHGPWPDRLCLVRLALQDPAATTVVASDERRDVQSVVVDPRTHRPQIAVVAGPRPTHRALDPGVAADLHELTDVAQTTFGIIGRCREDHRWLVALTGPDRPTRLVLWDRRHRERRSVAHLYPRLDRRRLAATTSFTVTARDGLALEGYVTRPPGPGPFPTVLLVHGGPWAEDVWEFVPEVQFLATRGFACLRVNYRGSEGRGAGFMSLADRDWGGAPQHDLDDTVAWAIAQGIADPDRIGVVGSSYGGYAALWSAVSGVPAARCVVAVSAPTDLVSFAEAVVGGTSPLRHLFRHRLGDPAADRALLEDRSPLTHARRCDVPVLLVHGESDALVPVEQSRRMAAALERSSARVQLHVVAGQGHALSPRCRRDIAHRVQRFLAENLLDAR